MGNTILLSKTDLEDILNGACILGCGGGGPLSIGQQLVKELGEKDPVQIVDPDDVPDTACMAISAVVGSPNASRQPTSRFPSEIALFAFNVLEEQIKSRFDYVLIGETGAGNSLIPLTVAASKGIPVVDADGARRAIPTFPLVTYADKGVSPSPVVLANPQDRVVFSVKDAFTADAATRGIINSGIWKQHAGLAFWSMDGATMKNAVVRNSLSFARALGQVLRESEPHEKVQAVVRYLGGRELIRGQIITIQESVRGGFDVGYMIIGAADKSQVWIYNKNENLIAWDPNKAQPLVMMPDLICCITTDGQPFSNADLKLVEGKEIAVIGAPAAMELRTPSLVEAFQDILRSIGYPGPFVPLSS